MCTRVWCIVVGYGVASNLVLWSPVGAPAGVPGPRRNADDCDAGWFAPVATRRRPMLGPLPGASPMARSIPRGDDPPNPPEPPYARPPPGGLADGSQYPPGGRPPEPPGAALCPAPSRGPRRWLAVSPGGTTPRTPRSRPMPGPLPGASPMARSYPPPCCAAAGIIEVPAPDAKTALRNIPRMPGSARGCPSPGLRAGCVFDDPADAVIVAAGLVLPGAGAGAGEGVAEFA